MLNDLSDLISKIDDMILKIDVNSFEKLKAELNKLIFEVQSLEVESVVSDESSKELIPQLISSFSSLQERIIKVKSEVYNQIESLDNEQDIASNFV